jgi:hypothetical protein
MLLQVVSVIVAPFGTTRMASAVANCSEGPWAVARFPPARAVEPQRIVAIIKAACRITGVRSDSFGLHKTRWCESCGGSSSGLGTSAEPDVSVQCWILNPDSLRVLAVVGEALLAGWEDVAIPIPLQREPPREESVPHSAPARPMPMTR